MKLGRLIIFDASAFVIAVLKADSVPEQALLCAAEVDVFALSAAVDAEISEVLNCSKLPVSSPTLGGNACSTFFARRLFGSNRPCA